jgi:hypothetical protein
MIRAIRIAIGATNWKSQRILRIPTVPNRESAGTLIRANFFPPIQNLVPLKGALRTTRRRASSADDDVDAVDAVGDARMTLSA